MKTFITKLGLAGIVLLIMNLFLYRHINKHYIAEYLENDTSYEQYLLADSHGGPLSTIAEDYGVYNFSYPSDSYIDMERKLDFLVKNTSVKKVYITVDPHSLSPYRFTLNNKARSVFYSSRNNFESAWEYFEKKNLQSRVVFVNGDYINFLKEKWQSQLFDGPVAVAPSPVVSTWADVPYDTKVQLSDKKVEKLFSYKSTSEQLVKSLENMIALCKKENIQLIGVRFPYSPLLTEKIGDKGFDVDSVFMKNDLLVLDYTDHRLWDVDENFADENHLTYKGGALLAEFLFDNKTNLQD